MNSVVENINNHVPPSSFRGSSGKSHNQFKKSFHFTNGFYKLLVCGMREKDAHRAHHGKNLEAFDKVKDVFFNNLPQHALKVSLYIKFLVLNRCLIDTSKLKMVA